MTRDRVLIDHQNHRIIIGRYPQSWAQRLIEWWRKHF
jgi:hypothetical protein